MRIGVLSDFVSTRYCCGVSVHALLLARLLRERGHEVVVIGPNPGSDDRLMDRSAFTFDAIQHPTFPGIRFSLPWPPTRLPSIPPLDVIHAQLSSHFLHAGFFVRETRQTALVNTCTMHLPAYAHNVVPERFVHDDEVMRRMASVAAWLEGRYARLCNRCDAMVVQSPPGVPYWQERGVTVPIACIPRPIDPLRFDAPGGSDPYPAGARPGSRLLTCSRLDREKDLPRLIRIFDERIAPAHADTSLSIVGGGPERRNLEALIRGCRHSDRLHLVGRVDPECMVDWYRHADVFVHVSLSEVFGNVVNEAMWCGIPIVAFDDHRGVHSQIQPEVDGILVDPDDAACDVDFARRVVGLLDDPSEAARLGSAAAQSGRRRSDPAVVMPQLESLYGQAIEHVHRHVSIPRLRPLASARRAHALVRHSTEWAVGDGTVLLTSFVGRSLGAVRGPDGV